MNRRLLSLLIVLLPLHVLADPVPAHIEWSQKVELSVPVSGVIERVLVMPGQAVHKDQLLLALDAVPFQAAVEEAQSTLTRREVDERAATRDYNQAKELYARTVASTVELENAEMTLTRAKAAVQSARAALAKARYDLRQSAIRAPLDGVVLNRQAEPGQTVISQLRPTPLLTLAASGRYAASARVSEARAANLTVGQPVTVAVGSARFAGQIAAISEHAQGQARDYEVRVAFSATQPLHVGEPASMELP